MIIRYTDVPLSEVIRHYIDGMTAQEGKIVDSDWWVDTVKNVVVIKAYIEVSDDVKPEDNAQ